MQDFPSSSVAEDDTISEASVSDLSRFIPKIPASPSAPHVISIGQLMESVLSLSLSLSLECVMKEDVVVYHKPYYTIVYLMLLCWQNDNIFGENMKVIGVF